MIVDDHTLLRESWEKILSFNVQYSIVFSTGDGEEAMRMAAQHRPDVILLDINLGQWNGFELCKQFLDICPSSKVIAVSMHGEPSYAKKMFQNGARGYVTKNSTTEELMKAIDEVVSGRTYVCSEMMYNLSTASLTDETAQAIESLTKRQLEIIGLLKRGFANKIIAQELSLSVKTVEVHKQNIFRLLKIKNSLALMKVIQDYGL